MFWLSLQRSKLIKLHVALFSLDRDDLHILFEILNVFGDTSSPIDETASLSDFAMDILQAAQAASNQGWVFPTLQRRALSDNSLSKLRQATSNNMVAITAEYQ